MSEWPTSNDYTAAIQNPQICFRDSDLKNCKSEVHHLTRMPKVWTGNFAQVYELKNGSRHWAVKCFTRSSSDVRRRYSTISNAIISANLPYFVNFLFIDDEMLVAGRRYPIVKMEWVQGQQLDKFIEANLYKPRTLLDLGSRLIQMVKALERNGLAHGDIQHGNVLLKNNELKLVDYDGLFVPDFRGTSAPEKGLSSYQHPLRNERYYDSTLDRFPVLVACTALCALAVDPSLWYEFSNGENLLFKKEDFENPNSSRLFSKLRISTDSQVKVLAELLRVASINNPKEVVLPSEEILSATTILKPWWVKPATISSASALTIQQQTMPLAGTLSMLKKHSTFLACTMASLGFFVIYMLDSIGGVTFSWLAIATFVTYLIERYAFFKKLPVFARRNELSKRLRELNSENNLKVAEQNKLQSEPARLSNMENQEKAAALKEYKERELMNALAKIDITRLITLRGFGPYVIGNLRASGIYNAADLRAKRWYSVRGVGTVKSDQIRNWLNQLATSAERNIPQTLPHETEIRIVSKYAQQRQNVINQLSSIGQRINLLRSELSQRQSEFDQLYIPSFGEFLKHNL